MKMTKKLWKLSLKISKHCKVYGTNFVKRVLVKHLQVGKLILALFLFACHSHLDNAPMGVLSKKELWIVIKNWRLFFSTTLSGRIWKRVFFPIIILLFCLWIKRDRRYKYMDFLLYSCRNSVKFWPKYFFLSLI